MIRNKAIFAVGATVLFLAVAMMPASADKSCSTLCEQEFTTVSEVIDQLLDDIEQAESFADVLKSIRNIYSSDALGRFPILTEIIKKIIDWTLSKRSLFSGSSVSKLFNNGLFEDRSKEKFIVSFGAYQKTIFSKKDEKVTLFKQGFAWWRYSEKAKLVKGRTVIIDRNPFAIQQRVKGAQLGIMMGFNGLFIDVESKLTGNSYVFIMGNARRAHSFDLTPFSER